MVLGNDSPPLGEFRDRRSTNAGRFPLPLTLGLVRGRRLWAFARQRDVRLGDRRPRLLVFAIATAALLSAVAASPAHADIDSITGTEKHWDGTVEVSTTTLTVTEGEGTTYSVRLSHDPIYYRHVENDETELVPCSDDSCAWWVFVRIGDQRPTVGTVDLDDDGQDDVRITPSRGRTFYRNDYRQWKTISVYAEEDDDTENQTVTFSHEVWGDDVECPIHNVGHVTVRIIDNDGSQATLPTLSVADATAEEGDPAQFRVTLSRASTQTVTVGYQTHQGTTASTQDFVGRSGTLTFAANTTQKTIAVQTREDTIDEPDETFTIQLSNPSGATLTDDVGIATITDNDPLPTLSVGDATVEEGGTASFEVTLSPASARTVTVDYQTVGGTAAEGIDYTRASGTLTFDAGETRQTIEVETTEDSDDEPDEAFTVRLSNPDRATLADDSGSGTIEDDDDTVNTLPTLSIGDATVIEGETASFEVTLTGTSTQTVTVAYETAGGSAVEGTDYTRASGTLTFAVGTTQRTIEVQTSEDSDDEADEAFAVRLTNPNGATLADDSGSGTIEDDDEGDGNGNDNEDGNKNEGTNTDGNDGTNTDGNDGTNSDGNHGHENWKHIARANRTILPEIGRALAFNAVRCRIDQAFAGAPRGAAQPAVSPLLSIAARAAHGQGEDGTGSLTLEQVFDGSSFLLPLIEENAAAARLATWACGDFRNLSGGGDGAVRWDGDVHTLQFGVDARVAPDMLAGVAVSRSGGSFDFVGEGGTRNLGGEYDLRLTGVHPYAGWSLSSDLEIWGTVGLAKGKLRVRDDLGKSMTSSATLTTGTVGVNSRLLGRETTTLRLKGEWSLARLDVAGTNAAFHSAEANLRRLRFVTEASHKKVVPHVGLLTPWGEVGLRHDGGDGETGLSLETGGGLRFRNIEQGWNAELSGRWLAVQEGALPEEKGFAARFRYDPDTLGFGPWVGLTQRWGESESGVQQVWEEDATNPAPHDSLARSLDAEVGYGLAAFGGLGLLAPYGTVSLDGDDGRAYRLGSRLTLGPAATLSLEAERRQRRADDDAHGVMLRSSARF